MSEPVASYNPDLSTPLDRVRFAIADIDMALPYLPDATINAVITSNGNDEQAAAVALARHLLAWAAGQPTRTVAADGQTTEFGKRLDGWKALIDAAPASAGGGTGANGGMRMHRPQRADYGDDEGEYSRGRR